ncbi:MAG TPA: RidA family protein [Daejeonella sp.]|nr:RidA family protein [Daejeonella sp.]
MKKIIYSSEAPEPIGPYSQAVIAGNFIYLSGQICIDPQTGELISGSAADETHQVMKNIGKVLEKAGYTYADIVKTTIFLSDMQLFAQVNEAYGSYFEENFPARETVAVAGLPKNVNVEISVTAYKS